MKCLVQLSVESVNNLKHDKETGIGYHIVAVELKDGRCFDQAVASEGCIIKVRGHQDVPFAQEDVQSVRVNHRDWNFREASDAARHRGKSRAAAA